MEQLWFQEQLQLAREMRSPIVIDEDLTLTDTVDLGGVNGLTILGASNYIGTTNNRASAVIQWQGPVDKPVFRFRGSGLFVQGLNIHVGDGSSAVFHFVDQPGFADGKSYIEKVSVTCSKFHSYDFVVCGERLSDGHCDTISISDSRTQHARAYLSVRNHQSMGHVIRSPHTFNSLIGLDLQAGGFVGVDGCWTSVQDRCLVQLGQQGRNNGMVVLSGVKVDTQTAKLDQFCIVRGNPSFCRFKMKDSIIPFAVSNKFNANDLIQVGSGVACYWDNVLGLSVQ